MPKHIFVSYSHRDEAQVQSVCARLTSSGFILWRDRDSILPGQDWKHEISRAMQTAAGAIVFLSKNWVNDRSYVNKELGELLDILSEYPKGQVFIVPVRLDDCDAPDILKHIQWIDLLPAGLPKVEESLRLLVKPEAPESDRLRAKSFSPWEEMLEELVSKGQMRIFHQDPWTSGPPEIVEFKQGIKSRLDPTFNLLEAKNWTGVIQLWRDLIGDPLFDVKHEYWRDRPFFRVYIVTGYIGLVQAHALLFTSNVKSEHGEKALDYLRHLLQAPPYSLRGASAERLPAETAEIQNLNFKDALASAKQWLESWGYLAGPEPSTIDELIALTDNKIAEIDFVLRRRT